MTTDARGSLRRYAPLLGALAMFGAFSIDTVFPAFPQLGAQFGVGKAALQQTISVYLFAYAGMSLLHGPLSDALGRKRVMLAGIGVFVLGSIGCALSTSLPMLLTFRGLQGLSAGVGLIIGRAVIRDVFDGRDAQRLMSQVTMIFGIAPAIAPIIGGWLLGWSRWPAIFLFLALFGSTLGLCVLRWLPETHPPAARTALQVRPLLQGYWTIARHAQFRRLSLAGALAFGGLFLYIASAPAVVLTHLRLGEADFGWFFVPMIACMMVGAFVSGRLAGRIDGVRQASIGFACCVFAGLANVLLQRTTTPEWLTLVPPVMLLAFGIALLSPIISLMNLELFPRQRGGASSVQAFVSLVTNAIVAGTVSPLVSSAPPHLALASAAFVGAAALVWWRILHTQRRSPAPAGDTLPLEPLDEL